MPPANPPRREILRGRCRRRTWRSARRSYEAFDRGDIDAAFKDLCARFRNSTCRRAIGIDRSMVQPRASWRRLDEQFAETWESVRYDADELIDAGEHVVMPFTNRLRGRDGIEVQARGTWLGTIRDGLIVRISPLSGASGRPSKPPGCRSRRCRRRTSRFVPRRDEILGMLAVELAQATMVGCGSGLLHGFGPETSHIRSPRAGLRAARPTVVSAPRGSALNGAGPD